MEDNPTSAPGWPGIPPRWASSKKSGVGTSLSPSSRVWFTLGHGIFNEIYYPRLDQACTRDMGLLVTDGKDFFSEEKRHTQHAITTLAQGIPAYHLTNTCEAGRYRLEKDILTDPQRDVVLQRTRFVPLQGSLADYHLYVLLAPHLGNQGADNTAWVGDYKGMPMLFAERDNFALALAGSAPWLKRSAGFVGSSDGWQDLNQHKQMTWTYPRAENGNVALIGEVDLHASSGEFVLALGFGTNTFEAGQRALASLLDGFDTAKESYIAEWQAWQHSMLPLDTASLHAAEPAPDQHDLYRISTAVLRIHESEHFPGGLIASLSIPWGFTKGDNDLGGYHLAWPRDLVETAGGLLAAGAHRDARRVLSYLQVTQEADGHWPQNMWLDGQPYWSGIQMDETAFPILLIDLACRENALHADDLDRLWPMARKAAAFLVCNGPVTQQDRWEEDPGYSPFTLAAEIAALLVAADLADQNGEPTTANYLRETADAWNASLDHWIYVTGTDLARQVGVEGYYVRVAPPEVSDASSPAQGFVAIKNRPPDQSDQPAAYIVSPDALALVRFGLRSALDPRMVNTVKVIDTLLKVETPVGPSWHRYNEDGYGEHEDGSPFDGTGIGRAWPLLTGERAHYELAAGRRQEAIRLLQALEHFAGDGGLLPEQVWDATDIPEAELFCGQPSGSAMPLVWAHAEYVKLRRSLKDGRVFDMPPQTTQRYIAGHTGSSLALWRFNLKCTQMPAGKVLRIELPLSATVRWSADGWQTFHELTTRDTGLGLHLVDLPTSDLPAGTQLQFTFYWTGEGQWEEQEYAVNVEGT
jgi:glucoamylase